MRIVLLITAVWGLSVMPVLCESGVSTKCCGQSAPASQASDCHEEDCPTQRDSDCDCPGCVELCNAQVTKPSSSTEAPEFWASGPAAMLPPVSDQYDSGRSLMMSAPSITWQLRFNLPYPASDRPLLI